MSRSADIQTALAALLAEPGALRVSVPIVARQVKELGAEIEAAAARESGLCCYVMPVLPKTCVHDVPFVFFDQGEVRVRVIEQPARNGTGASGWQLAEDIANALHWQPRASGTPLGPLLAHPLQLAPRTVDQVSDRTWRIIDVILQATYQLAPRAVPVAALTIAGTGFAEDLQAALIAQLTAGMETSVPVLAKRGNDLASAVAASGEPVKIEVPPPVPARAAQGVPFVFWEGWEARVRISEEAALNEGPDLYDLIEDAASALHWQAFDGLLAHPLQLARRCTEDADDPQHPHRRVTDLVFHAVAGFLPAEE